MQWIREYLQGRVRKLSDLLDVVASDYLASVPVDDDFRRFLGDGPTDDLGRFDVPKRLAMPRRFFTAEHVLLQHERADWQHVRPDVRRFYGQFYWALRRRGIPMWAHTAWRTAEEQAALVSAGRSQTPPPVAAHVQGAAVDVVHSRFAWSLSRDEWRLVGKIGKAVAARQGIDIVWGGDWDFYDPAHWEIRGWRTEVAVGPDGSPVSPVDVEQVRRTPMALRREFPSV